MAPVMTAPHLPVLLETAIEALRVRAGGLYVDATYGAGGHARAVLARLDPSAGGRLIALDVDPTVAPEPAPGLTFAGGRDFRDLARVLDELGVARVDGVLFDFGVSSMQLDRAERGFSIGRDAPLDMRMNPQRGRSAADLLRELPESALAEIIFRYGEERGARRIARAIARRREEGTLPGTTTELARLVAGALRTPPGRRRIHPATRTFQALRIAVNDELAAIESGLGAAIDRLAPGGRLVALSFHSLEDRIVKNVLRHDPRIVAITKRPIVPGDEEIARNPRARSAKLRIGERVEASPRS